MSVRHSQQMIAAIFKSNQNFEAIITGVTCRYFCTAYQGMSLFYLMSNGETELLYNLQQYF